VQGQNIEIFSNKGEKLGHDWCHLYLCNKVNVYDNEVTARSNNAIRLRVSSNCSITSNKFYGSSESYAPLVQVENLENVKTVNNLISNNYIHGALGPNIWVLGKYAGNAGLLIKGNKILEGGQMPANSHIPGVGGIVCSGWNVTIEENEFENNRGYAIMFGKYVSESNVPGLQAIVRGNKILNTKASFTLGRGSGAGIANLVGGRYKIVQSDNAFAGNVMNTYGL
jgi:hypothetical protein